MEEMKIYVHKTDVYIFHRGDLLVASHLEWVSPCVLKHTGKNEIEVPEAPQIVVDWYRELLFSWEKWE